METDNNRSEFRVPGFELETTKEFSNAKLETRDAKLSLTPLMQQYHEIKARHPHEMLLFRLGDFYEIFDEDAQRAAPILEVALTHRQHVPMCGVPAHSVDPYVAKLLKAGLRVAIADQLEDPALAKGLVRRDVVRVITAGTLQEDSLLPAKRCNFLAALHVDKNGMGLAAIECSTGEFIATQTGKADPSSRLWDELARLAPSEILVSQSAENQAVRERLRKQGWSVSELSAAEFSEAVADERLKSLFKTGSLKGFGLEEKPLALVAAGVAAHYLETTQCGRPTALQTLRTYSLEDCLQMDAHTLDHLDLVHETVGAGKSRTLLDVIDQTVTSAGARLMRRWLVAPLRDPEAIRKRQDKVEFFMEGKEGRRHLRALFQGWPDIERILTRLVSRTLWPRDLASLGYGLRRIPKIKSFLTTDVQQATRMAKTLSSEVMAFLTEFPEDVSLADLLERAVVEAPPATLKNGGVLRAGYDAALDEARSWIHDGKNKLLDLERREREQSGISTLKVGFNSVFGYFIEVTRTHLSRVPTHYIRKQTTANGERYITPELKELETRILGAEERALRLETVLVQILCEEIITHSETLRWIAQVAAELDVFLSLAEIAERRRYVKPIVDTSDSLIIREGRHPVLEDVLPSGTLVPNDVDLNGTDKPILILTGPNMSGKSTYLRQTALIAVLAQLGSYVPAAEARIGVLDHLFTRIGASDRLTEGESTFMVEMAETARILNHATPRSLVILDEVGRGTSTYDGIAIAWACLEYLREMKPKVLFATHYFELTRLADQWPEVHNAHVTAREWGGDVVFLHKVEPGPADRAYGIHVAKLAGVPKRVLVRAAALLSTLEKTASRPRASDQPFLFAEPVISKAEPENDTLTRAWLEELRQLDANEMTPMQALLKIQELKARYTQDKKGDL